MIEKQEGKGDHHHHHYHHHHHHIVAPQRYYQRHCNHHPHNDRVVIISDNTEISSPSIIKSSLSSTASKNTNINKPGRQCNYILVRIPSGSGWNSLYIHSSCFICGAHSSFGCSVCTRERHSSVYMYICTYMFVVHVCICMYWLCGCMQHWCRTNICACIYVHLYALVCGCIYNICVRIFMHT